MIQEIVEDSNGNADTIQYYWGKYLSGSSQGAGGVGGLVAVYKNGDWYLPLCTTRTGISPNM